MGSLFISFRGQTDATLAATIDSILIENGHSTFFYPHSSHIGEDYEINTNEALAACDKVVVVGTPAYFEFEEETIREAELKYAVETGKLVLLLFRNAEPPQYARKIIAQEFRRGPADLGFMERLLEAVTGKQSPLPPIDWDLNRLPGRDNDFEFVGREEELAAMTEAYNDKACKIICVVASSQRGKSALVSAWLGRKRKDWRSEASKAPSSVFAYSFAAQGAQGAVLAADKLFQESLPYFMQGTTLETDPKRLARALFDELTWERKPLLILDGLEPLQLRTGLDRGAIREQNLNLFLDKVLKDLTRGKLVISTQIMPPSLIPYVERGVRVIPLRPLDAADSRLLLQDTGVSSNLDAYAEGCHGEPLCLNLVGPAVSKGSYSLSEFQRHVAGAKGADGFDPRTFVRLLLEAQLPKLGPAPAALLHGAAMFDEPSLARSRLRDELFAKASIPMITEPLRARTGWGMARFSEPSYAQALSVLRERRLIHADEVETGGGAMSGEIQLHALVREASRAILKETMRDVWRRANWIIYRAIVTSVRRFRPNEKAQLQTLYSAVRFGVEAGRGVWAGWMYGLRCLRGYRAFSTNHEGMIGEDVEVMAHYFVGDEETHWKSLKEDIGLRAFDKGIACSWAGLVLIGTNQLREGCRLMAVGLKSARAAGAFVTASRTARHLAFIQALMGNEAECLALAEESIEDLKEKRPLLIWLIDLPLIMMPHQRMSAHANLGCMLHYFGQLQAAEHHFQLAEEEQARATRYPKLRAIWGYRYADLLLDLGRFDDVEARLESAMIDPDEPRGWGEGIFAKPLLELGYVRLRIRQADHFGDKRDWERVERFAKQFENFGEPEQKAAADESDDTTGRPVRSKDELRKRARPKRQRKAGYATRLDVLIPSFRAGAAGVARLSGDLAKAERQLRQAEESAKSAGITLFENEIAVERARIFLASGNPEGARAVLLAARDAPKPVSYRRHELERLIAQQTRPL